MRTDIVSLVALGLACGANAAAPTFSCFDPPDEGQTNPLGEGMEDIVEAMCCEALVDQSDMDADRLVVWDPLNCNHGPGPYAITEEPLCRAHDTDGCRFCFEECDGTEDICVLCSEVLAANAGDTAESTTPAPVTPAAPTGTPAPIPLGGWVVTPAPITPTVPVETPAPIAPAAPTGTLAPITPAAPTGTPAPIVDGAATSTSDDFEDGCGCVEKLSQEEALVLERMGKMLVCDVSCSDGSDLVWGVINCNYFGLGQNCRVCSGSCVLSEELGMWLDQFGDFCKPCSAIVS